MEDIPLMKVHLIIDFQYNYYRNKFAFLKREQRGANRLSTVIDGKTIDVTYLYLTLKDIESYRKSYATNKDSTTNDVYVSIAVDSKTDRKLLDAEYKANRGDKLDNSDYSNIRVATEILKEAGYNVYKRDGYEADDIIKSLVDNYKSDFDLTIIHTNDSDICVNLDKNVVIARFKSSLKKHIMITTTNFEDKIGTEFKCDLPFNSILLYKSLVGDKSDGVAGVRGLGPKTFSNIIRGLRELHDYKYFVDLQDKENTRECLKELYKLGKLSEMQLNEALHSLTLVEYKELDEKLEEPVKNDSYASRKQAYSKYCMLSLIN